MLGDVESVDHIFSIFYNLESIDHIFFTFPWPDTHGALLGIFSDGTNILFWLLTFGRMDPEQIKIALQFGIFLYAGLMWVILAFNKSRVISFPKKSNFAIAKSS
jgi:hypothetical protein